MNPSEPNFNTDNIFIEDTEETKRSNYDDDEENNIRDDKTRIKSNRTRLSLEQEKKLQKLPSFTVGEAKRDRIDSAKYLDFSEYKPLTIYNFPFFFWMVGLAFILSDVLLIVNMILKKKDNNFINGFYGKNLWEYFILFIIFLIGFSFFCVAKYESITIDKTKGLMTLKKFELLYCKIKELIIPLDQINSVFPVRVQSPNTPLSYTCLNKIGITFNHTSTIYLFKTICAYFVIKDVIKIRAYLYRKIQPYETVKEELFGTEVDNVILQ